MISRTFKSIPEDELLDASRDPLDEMFGDSFRITWDELLRSRRILLISEAGAGKTHECREQAIRLWNAGEAAFFVELALLKDGGVRDQLDEDQEARLDAWMSAQTGTATFFLDSIDELKLTLGSFESALKRFKKSIGQGNLARARIVITTRPVQIETDIIRRVLPIPAEVSIESIQERFVQLAMGDRSDTIARQGANEAPKWRTARLLPLSNSEIVDFARVQSVEDAEALLADLRQRDAEEYARRPQDLIELCADWREHRRIRTHRDQVESNVRVKLLPSANRDEPAPLSPEKALEGASRLALVMLLTRRLTIRHGASSDDIGGEPPLNPSYYLRDWDKKEIQALLERPLFGLASIGRVRFHHRSALEFLAAKRLQVLCNQGMPFRSLRRLLFTQSMGRTIARPSMRPVAGWLAASDNRVFELLRDHEPEVVFNEGDPETLTTSQRSQALRAYVARYGKGGSRGQHIPHIQIHRFAAPDLSGEIRQLWNDGIQNPEVRHTVLQLIETGLLSDCADVAYQVTADPDEDMGERMVALDALVSLKDRRLEEIADAVADCDEHWKEEIALGVVLRLFPSHMSVDTFSRAIAGFKEESSFSDTAWHLARLIRHWGKSQPELLPSIRDVLVNLTTKGLRRRTERPRMVSDRSYLCLPLAATCMQAPSLDNDAWLHASALAICLHRRGQGDDELPNELRRRLAGLDATANARLFHLADELAQSLHFVTDPWERLNAIVGHEGAVELRPDRDLGWVTRQLRDIDRAVDERAVLLEAAMRLSPDPQQWLHHGGTLRPFVVDNAALSATLEGWLTPRKRSPEEDLWAEDSAREQKQREVKAQEDRASWHRFWREVAEHPDDAFSGERGQSTAWNLWKAMSRDGDSSRASDWNRTLIEANFGRAAADRLRVVLMTVWREWRPTMPSERPLEARGEHLRIWELGLAAIYAEAEDAEWAKRLSDDEARLAARYVPMQLNRVPGWLEGLIAAGPDAVDAVIGAELSWELSHNYGPERYSSLLQHLSHADARVTKLFLPRIRAWIDNEEFIAVTEKELPVAMERLRRAVGLLLNHGDDETNSFLQLLAVRFLADAKLQRFDSVWLSALLRLNPALGTATLEERLSAVAPAKHSDAVRWFSMLFVDRADAVDLKAPGFTPDLLLRLLRLAYRHVRREDDNKLQGAREVNARDNAERARNAILSALLEAKGPKAWEAKIAMANDPLCAHFKDRFLAIAEENRALELDSDILLDSQAADIDRVGEAPAATRHAMFELLNDRLADIDDLLLSDASPRELWASIGSERLMRRAVARELEVAARGLYKVNQEAVTAEEKETDIRLQSTISDQEAVIELKLADERTAKDLLDSISHQLVDKYMNLESRRAGCLLLTLSKDRKWDSPDGIGRIGVNELIEILRVEAGRVEAAMGYAVSVSVHFLDLRPRLGTELKFAST